jgi:CubicO group peptidase (beta-lactamase class C family)
LRSRLPDLLAEHGVPGAVVAVGAGEEIVDTAAGVLSTATGVEASVDSIFQIGSITKVFTATLVQQLVDEGRIDIDAPVRTWLPEFEIADPRAAERITIRQLLCHVSGFEGDIFTDTGRGDDCVEKYVAALAAVPQLFPPGEMWSYNNAAYCVLGRLIEVVRGRAYDACLRDQLLTPLGMTHTATDAYEAVLHRVAVGHVQVADGSGLQPTRTWALPRSNAPAGAMLAMRARDLLTFARMHLDQGRAQDGMRVVSEGGVRSMQEEQVALPDIAHGAAWALGWEVYSRSPQRVIGHDGNTIGQSAFLRVVPDHDLAVVVLTNGGDGRPVHAEVAGRILRELAGIQLPARPTPADARRGPLSDTTRYVGRYDSVINETVVSEDRDGRLWLDRTPVGVLAELGERSYHTELVAWRDDSFVPLEPEGGVHAPVAFVGDDGTGRAAYLHTGRADRRVD